MITKREGLSGICGFEFSKLDRISLWLDGFYVFLDEVEILSMMGLRFALIWLKSCQ